MTYWDHAATTPMYSEVINTMAEVMKLYYGNPSSLHKAGLEAEQLVRRARETIAVHLGVLPEEIIFTSGGTESNNLAIQGIARRFQGRGRHLITTAIEHASVFETFRQLEREGFDVTYLPVDSNGAVSVEAVREALSDSTILVSIMHVNNETGRIQPIADIGRLLKERRKTIFHVDAIQSVGKLEVYPAQWGIDLLSASAHKLGGPKGAGFLYCRRSLELQPLLFGGGQERGLRSGTENVASIVGMAKAVRIASDNRLKHAGQASKLRMQLIEGIRRIKGAVLNGLEQAAGMSPFIIHFSVPGVKAEVLVHALEQHGMYVSTQSACASSDGKPSRVLLAMEANRSRAISGIRISLSGKETEEEAERLLNALKQSVDQLRQTIRNDSLQDGGKL